jgi:hypothetical protein
LKNAVPVAKPVGVAPTAELIRFGMRPIQASWLANRQIQSEIDETARTGADRSVSVRLHPEYRRTSSIESSGGDLHQ